MFSFSELTVCLLNSFSSLSLFYFSTFVLSMDLYDQNIVNPHLPSGLVHPFKLDESISNFRCPVYFSIFILFSIDLPVSKQ